EKPDAQRISRALRTLKNHDGSFWPRVSRAKGMTARPRTKGIAVRAMTWPRDPVQAIKPAMAKFAAAPMKRPKLVQKAKAVARMVVVYCPGSQRLNMAKFPPARPKKNRMTRKGVSPFGKSSAQPKASAIAIAMPAK